MARWSLRRLFMWCSDGDRRPRSCTGQPWQLRCLKRRGAGRYRIGRQSCRAQDDASDLTLPPARHPLTPPHSHSGDHVAGAFKRVALDRAPRTHGQAGGRGRADVARRPAYKRPGRRHFVPVVDVRLELTRSSSSAGVERARKDRPERPAAFAGGRRRRPGPNAARPRALATLSHRAACTVAASGWPQAAARQAGRGRRQPGGRAAAPLSTAWPRAWLCPVSQPAAAASTPRCPPGQASPVRLPKQCNTPFAGRQYVTRGEKSRARASSAPPRAPLCKWPAGGEPRATAATAAGGPHLYLMNG